MFSCSFFRFFFFFGFSYFPFLFFFNDTATTEIYTLSLHDALPISHQQLLMVLDNCEHLLPTVAPLVGDRKSTRLNSSHRCMAYAVFCLKKKKEISESSPAEYYHEPYFEHNRLAPLF